MFDGVSKDLARFLLLAGNELFVGVWPGIEVSPTSSPLCRCSVFSLVGPFHPLSQTSQIVSSKTFVVLVCVFVRDPSPSFSLLKIMVCSSPVCSSKKKKRKKTSNHLNPNMKGQHSYQNSSLLKRQAKFCVGSSRDTTMCNKNHSYYATR